ncbi:MAG: ABC transporter ATP-binding protein [Acidimicrobiia bacterium]
MIDFSHVSYDYDGVAALDDVSLSVGPERFVSLIGPSGCGKSTLLRLAAGLLAMQRGELRTDPVAYQPQKDALMPWQRVVANAALGSEIAGVPKAQARRAAVEHLDRFGLAGFARAWPHQLSGGMRQRLALLRTFLTPRSTLLLDEPFGALDALTRRDLYGWLEDVWSADRRTVLLVTHDIDEALVLSDAIVVLSPRPARVVASFEVTTARPRRGADLDDATHRALKRQVLAALSSDSR